MNRSQLLPTNEGEQTFCKSPYHAVVIMRNVGWRGRSSFNRAISATLPANSIKASQFARPQQQVSFHPAVPTDPTTNAGRIGLIHDFGRFRLDVKPAARVDQSRGMKSRLSIGTIAGRMTDRAFSPSAAQRPPSRQDRHLHRRHADD